MSSLTVTVAGVDRTTYLCGPSSGQPAVFEEALRERKRFTCVFRDPAGVWMPRRGQGIQFAHSELGALFGGYVSTATRWNPPGTARWNGDVGDDLESVALFSNVTCVAYEHVCNRRLCIARSWTGQLAGAIFNEIISESLIDEGITAAEFEAGPTIPYFEVMEPRPPVDVALDRLCELASSGGDRYYWDIKANKVARFFRQDTYNAPFNLTDASPYVLGNSGEYAKVDETNQGLVNRVVVFLGQFLRDVTTESQPGNGTKTFEVDFAIGETPTITWDAGLGPVDQEVGVDGVDTGKKFYWRLGSNSVRQDDSEPTVGVYDTLAITYRGLDRRALGPYDDSVSGNAEGVLQGDGTGLYETMVQIDQVGTAADAETLAQSYLDRYKQATVTFQGATLTEGLRAGQQININLTTLQIDLTMLIESVTMTDIGRGSFLWAFEAIYGPARDDWKRALLGQEPSSTVTGIGASTGAVGPEGPPGEPGGVGTAAPNVTATAATFYEPWANSQRFGFQGVITLPVADPDFDALKQIDVIAIDPNGQEYLLTSFTDAEWIGSPPATTIPYSGTVDEQAAAYAGFWTVKFVCRNANGAPSDNPYTVTGLSVVAAAITAITANEID